MDDPDLRHAGQGGAIQVQLDLGARFLRSLSPQVELSFHREPGLGSPNMVEGAPAGRLDRISGRLAE
jgi:hypothetical protein